MSLSSSSTTTILQPLLRMMMVTKKLSILFVSILLLHYINVNQVVFAFTITRTTIKTTGGTGSRSSNLLPFVLALNSNSNSNSDSESTSESKSFFTQLPNESNDTYFQRITNAASDPLLFEQMVLHTNTKTNTNTNTEQQQPETDTTTTTTTTTGTSTTTSGYVRAEIWEEEQQKQKKQLSWNDKVQFDGQRYGNQYIQNEILRKNLKGF